MKLTLMGQLIRLSAVLACACAAGCATPPASQGPSTTVILLPDADGQVGAVVVGTDGGSQRIDQAYSGATVHTNASAPPQVHEIGREGVTAAYAELLKAQPPAPATFVLTFLVDRTALTESSKAELPALFAELSARRPTEIMVYGHADASGGKERNFKLSAERARFVAELLRTQHPTLERIEIQAFGDAVPLAQSQTRAADPRNRRVEIVIF